MKEITHITGFALNCGPDDVTIMYRPPYYIMDNNLYLRDDLINWAERNYPREEIGKFLSKVDDATDMKWLAGEPTLEHLETDKNAVSKYTRKYDEKLYRDDDPVVRLNIAYCTSKYDHILKDSNEWYVRCAISDRDNAYDDLFSRDINHLVRAGVAKRTRKYDESFRYDTSWCVRAEVAKHTNKYDEQFINDECLFVRYNANGCVSEMS